MNIEQVRNITSKLVKIGLNIDNFDNQSTQLFDVLHFYLNKMIGKNEETIIDNTKKELLISDDSNKQFSISVENNNIKVKEISKTEKETVTITGMSGAITSYYQKITPSIQEVTRLDVVSLQNEVKVKLADKVVENDTVTKEYIGTTKFVGAKIKDKLYYEINSIDTARNSKTKSSIRCINSYEDLVNEEEYIDDLISILVNDSNKKLVKSITKNEKKNQIMH